VRRAVRGVVVLAALVVVYLLADAFMPSHLPPGIVLLGLVLGALSSLVALGLVLVYRAFRIVNFSQVAMGALGASSAIVLATGFHWPYLPSVACGLAVAVAVGWVVDALFGWRFATSPRLIVTVATIGLLQLLGAAQIGLPHVVDHSLSPMASFAFPLHLNFSLDPTVFSADDLVALVVVPVVALALWWFFSRTDTGLAVRAAADSGERALLLGIPVRRLNRTVWLLAAGLSGIGAVLAVPITQSTVGVASGPEDLLAPLAAAVLARFESMPATVAWSLVIGVLQQSVYWSFHSSTYADIALFLLIVGGLVFQRRRSWRGETDPGLGDWVAVREVRRIPAALASLPEVRLARGLGLTALLSAAVLVPAIFSVAVVGPLAQATIYAVVAVSLVVLTGWAGQISLGQAAFAGVGSLATGALLVHAGADLFVALGVSAVVGAVVACLVGLPALRLPGLQLAVVTLAFSVVVSEWLLSPQYFPLLNPDQVGRPVLFGRFDLSSHTSFYELCLAVLVVSLLLARNFRRSRIGRAVLASRDGARSAASFGISPWRAKLVAFAFAGALCGVAGGLYVVAVGGSGLTGFDADQSVLVFSMAVIGGLGSLSGGLLGAAYVWAALTWLPGGFAPLATGAGLLLVLAVFPEGLAGAVLVVRDRLLAVVARRHGLVESIEGPGEEWVDGPGEESVDGSPGALPLLAAEGLTVSIGATRVLTGVDLSVDRGTVLAVLGTNGAGKSTLLRTLAGLIRPEEGTVWFGGRDVTGLPPAVRVQAGLVTVLGGRGVFPSLSVDDNLRLAGWTLRRHHHDREALVAAEERVAALFPVFGRRRSVRAGDLSGGEQQMLALAQSLLCRPTLLMIDELSLGLAPTVVAELLDAVRALVAEGVTVVVVEQSVNAAAAIAPSGVFLERGTVWFRGPVALLSDPLGAPLPQPSMASSSGGGGPTMPIDGTPAAV
jgi:branched-chain amino acid transport system permease protein